MSRTFTSGCSGSINKQRTSRTAGSLLLPRVGWAQQRHICVARRSATLPERGGFTWKTHGKTHIIFGLFEVQIVWMLKSNFMASADHPRPGRTIWYTSHNRLLVYNVHKQSPAYQRGTTKRNNHTARKVPPYIPASMNSFPHLPSCHL